MARLAEDRELLKEFGATIFAYDPGVSSYLHPNPNSPTMHFTGFEWEWLRPLLRELRDHRQKSR